MKVMLSLRIEEALREQLELEAQSEQRNLTNMLEVILTERYAIAPNGTDGNRSDEAKPAGAGPVRHDLQHREPQPKPFRSDFKGAKK